MRPATRYGRWVVFEGGQQVKLNWRQMFAIKVLRIGITARP